jgi:hypothetical protein
LIHSRAEPGAGTDRAGDELLDAPRPRAPLELLGDVGQVFEDSSVASGLSVSIPPKLRVTGAETEDMPLYLRVFFRLLSSWVHQSADLDVQLTVFVHARALVFSRSLS